MIVINPDAAAFCRYAEAQGDAIFPLVFCAPVDNLFVWSAFENIEQNSECAFLLESADVGKNSRYSYMGASPRRLLTLQNGIFCVRDKDGKVIEEKPCADPLAELEKRMRPYLRAPVAELPPFLGGIVGYAGYDCARYYEPIGDENPDELGIPDMAWMETETLLIFDHHRHNLYIVRNCRREEGQGGWQKFYHSARRDAEQLLAAAAKKPNAPPPQIPHSNAAPPPLKTKSNFSRAEYCAAVERVKKHIAAGDIFQAVPSRRLSFAQPAPAFHLYRSLRRVNPSPYMFYFKCGGFVVAASSPELLASCENGKAMIRPIAGTRPRGKTAAEDLRMEEQLRNDAKERAEHLMLVDLGRNDIGRVAKIGTVAVPPHKFCAMERYSHVMHMCSDVSGEMAAGKSAFDLARAAFPAGTLSGAPKVRAMQIINDIEPCKRNAYGGFAGFFGYDGNMATCIVIRAMVIKDGVCYAQAGGGVVADSDPQKEYEETESKAKAVLRAAQMAQAAPGE
ncbi:MAG: anthranilate synthase component I family protein [Gammaproteobacteria bacterium]